MSNLDDLPRIFQANVHRLFQRVILRGLDGLRICVMPDLSNPQSLGDFVLRAEAQVDNYTANEAAKAYALILAGLFERQLRIWARSKQLAPPAKIQTEKFKTLLTKVAKEANVDLEEKSLGQTLIEMFLVANVFRHGDGSSVESLRHHSPELWDLGRSSYVDLLPPNIEASEKLILRRDDVIRYAYGCGQFWGCADKQPGATSDPPYR